MSSIQSFSAKKFYFDWLKIGMINQDDQVYSGFMLMFYFFSLFEFWVCMVQSFHKLHFCSSISIHGVSQACFRNSLILCHYFESLDTFMPSQWQVDTLNLVKTFNYDIKLYFSCLNHIKLTKKICKKHQSWKENEHSVHCNENNMLDLQNHINTLRYIIPSPYW